MAHVNPPQKDLIHDQKLVEEITPSVNVQAPISQKESAWERWWVVQEKRTQEAQNKGSRTPLGMTGGEIDKEIQAAIDLEYERQKKTTRYLRRNQGWLSWTLWMKEWVQEESLPGSLSIKGKELRVMDYVLGHHKTLDKHGIKVKPFDVASTKPPYVRSWWKRDLYENQGEKKKRMHQTVDWALQDDEPGWIWLEDSSLGNQSPSEAKVNMYDQGVFSAMPCEEEASVPLASAYEAGKAVWKVLMEYGEYVGEQRFKKLLVHSFQKHGAEFKAGVEDQLGPWMKEHLLRAGVQKRNNQEIKAWKVWLWVAEAGLKAKVWENEEKRWSEALDAIKESMGAQAEVKPWTPEDVQRREWCLQALQEEDLVFLKHNAAFGRLIDPIDVNVRLGGSKKELGVTALGALLGKGLGGKLKMGSLKWLLEQGANPWLMVTTVPNPLAPLVEALVHRGLDLPVDILQQWVMALKREELPEHKGWERELLKEGALDWIRVRKAPEIQQRIRGVLEQIMLKEECESVQTETESEPERESEEAIKPKSRRL